MQRQQAHCRTRISDAKLEMAEEVLNLSDRNVQLTMEILIDSNADTSPVLVERADNIARMATLVQRIKDQIESGQEKELFEAASARWASVYNYSQTLHHLIDRNKNEVGKAMANTMLPLLVDNASWRAFVQVLRAQMRSSEEGKEPDSALFAKTIEYVRANRELKTAVAEHKRITEKLSQMHSIIECSNDAIIIHALDGTIVSWNMGAENIYGYSASEAVGQSRTLLLQPAQTDELPEIIETLKSGERVQHSEGAHIRKDGQRIDVSMMFSPVKDASETVIGAAAIVRDITQRKVLEAQLRQSQKMESIGRLSGGIAHDFNNLLGVIVGYSSVLEERLAGSAELTRCVQEIKKAGQRATGLTRQLLAFSRQQVLEPKVLNLNNVVADVSKMLLRLIGEDIELKTILQPDLGRVKADQGQIEQAIMNLAVNARDAMPGGGKLIIETANVFFDEFGAQQNPPLGAAQGVMLAMTDNGIGMDKNTQSRIFEPFFTTKEKDKGTGLGLSVVYGVVKQSGGHITVSSELGKGTTFTIFLPLVNDAIEKERLAESPRSCNGSETILLVEDEDSLRILTRSLLAQSGYTVLDANNGAQALELASKHRGSIHLLLTDVVLPGMGGTALAREISRECPDTNVLFMSGYTSDVVAVQRMLEQGIFLLQKPFDPEALRKKVREVLDTKDHWKACDEKHFVD
jgi:two-component system cell cycle sensor histidine kinase/response regulator CckA